MKHVALFAETEHPLVRVRCPCGFSRVSFSQMVAEAAFEAHPRISTATMVAQYGAEDERAHVAPAAFEALDEVLHLADRMEDMAYGLAPRQRELLRVSAWTIRNAIRQHMPKGDL